MEIRNKLLRIKIKITKTMLKLFVQNITKKKKERKHFEIILFFSKKTVLFSESKIFAYNNIVQLKKARTDIKTISKGLDSLKITDDKVLLELTRRIKIIFNKKK